MTNINDSYLDRYRRKLSDLHDIEHEIRELRDRYDRELASASDRQMRICNEIREMRQVITTMIDQGCDAVEAKLRTQTSLETVWEKASWDKISIDESYGHSHNLSIGMADLSTTINLTKTPYDSYSTMLDER